MKITKLKEVYLIKESDSRVEVTINVRNKSFERLNIRVKRDLISYISESVGSFVEKRFVELKNEPDFLIMDSPKMESKLNGLEANHIFIDEAKKI